MKIPQDDINELRTAMRQLLPRHLTWCVDAALQTMIKNAVAVEEELARHAAFPCTPNYTETTWEAGHIVERVSREVRAAKLREDLVQYAKVIQFLRVLRDVVIRFNAEHTTIEFGDQ